MRIGSKVLALSSLVALAACNNEPKTVVNVLEPNPATARVRIMNATSSLVADFGIGSDFQAVNSNVGRGSSRCLEVDPANPQLVVEVGTGTRGSTSATRTAVTVSQTGLEGGHNYFMVVYHPTTSATNLATARWEHGVGYTPAGDSAGLRMFNAVPAAGNVNLYTNLPAVDPAPEPNASTMTPDVAALPVGQLSNFFTIFSSRTYQYRIFRLPVTSTSTPVINTTNSLQPNELGTIVFYPSATSLTSTSGLGASTTGGC